LFEVDVYFKVFLSRLEFINGRPIFAEANIVWSLERSCCTSSIVIEYSIPPADENGVNDQNEEKIK